MIFNSLHFAVFFPLVLLGAWLLRGHIVRRNAFLLVASYYFYGVWDWRFLGLLILSTTVDWGVGLWLGPVPTAPNPHEVARRKRVLAISVVVNLAILGFFKYFNFFVESTVEVLRAMGFDPHIAVLQVVLPVGISFYTFQSMSYTIDVYRGDLPPERSLPAFALYVSFFPQLVAGPIERATHLLPQFETVRRVRREDVYWGCWMISSGLFKKVVIADNVALVADKVFGASDPAGLTVLLGVYAFAVQIYCDFSGYSDIARGTAKLLGFDMMANFNLPYLATNPSDFWRRWHISLSTWLRDYLYVPLGGNRKGEGRTYVNLMATMLLGGLWHGAAWNFLIWGGFHGAMLCVHRALQPSLARWVDPRGPVAAKAWWCFRVLVFFHLTCVGWLLFRADSATQIGQMFSALATRPWLDRAILPETDLLVLAVGACTLFAAQAVQYATKDMYMVFRLPVPARALVYACLILGFVLWGNYGGVQFIYFQF